MERRTERSRSLEENESTRVDSDGDSPSNSISLPGFSSLISSLQNDLSFTHESNHQNTLYNSNHHNPNNFLQQPNRYPNPSPITNISTPSSNYNYVSYPTNNSPYFQQFPSNGSSAASHPNQWQAVPTNSWGSSATTASNVVYYNQDSMAPQDSSFPESTTTGNQLFGRDTYDNAA